MKRAKLGGLLLTLAVHAGLVLAVFGAHQSAAALPQAPRDYMVAKLVRLGRPRDPHLLPVKPTETAAASAPTSPSPTTEPQVSPSAPTPTPQSNQNDFEQARLRAKALGEQTEEPTGSPEGSPMGTAETAAEGDPYATAIDAAIRAQWQLPDLVRPEQLVNLAATVFLRIDRLGNILESRVVQASGNRFFDASVVEALARVKQFPAPPVDRLNEILEGGIALVFTP